MDLSWREKSSEHTYDRDYIHVVQTELCYSMETIEIKFIFYLKATKSTPSRTIVHNTPKTPKNPACQAVLMVTSVETGREV